MTAIQLELPLDMPATPHKPMTSDAQVQMAMLKHTARAMDTIFTLITGEKSPFQTKP